MLEATWAFGFLISRFEANTVVSTGLRCQSRKCLHARVSMRSLELILSSPARDFTVQLNCGKVCAD